MLSIKTLQNKPIAQCRLPQPPSTLSLLLQPSWPSDGCPLLPDTFCYIASTTGHWSLFLLCQLYSSLALHPNYSRDMHAQQCAFPGTGLDLITTYNGTIGSHPAHLQGEGMAFQTSCLTWVVPGRCEESPVDGSFPSSSFSFR